MGDIRLYKGGGTFPLAAAPVTKLAAECGGIGGGGGVAPRGGIAGGALCAPRGGGKGGGELPPPRTTVAAS